MNPAYQLVIRKGPTPGQIFPLTALSYTVGRDPLSDISINDPEVSRQHARFTQTSDSYQIEDLESTNGTFVNGVQISTTPVQLAHGNEIQFGSGVSLIFELAVDVVADAKEIGIGVETAVVPPSAIPQPDTEEFDPMLPPEFDDWMADPAPQESMDAMQAELDEALNPEKERYQVDLSPTPDSPAQVIVPPSASSPPPIKKDNPARHMAAIAAALILLMMCCCCGFLFFMYAWGGDWLLQQMGLLP